MSQVIELKDEVFTILKRNAENDGVTPEVWVEKKIKENSNGEVQKKPFEITDEERKELHEYNDELDKRFGKIMRKKLRKQGLQLNETNSD